MSYPQSSNVNVFEEFRYIISQTFIKFVKNHNSTWLWAELFLLSRDSKGFWLSLIILSLIYIGIQYEEPDVYPMENNRGGREAGKPVCFVITG